MRLLLDEMHSPAVATRLRADGHDVIAVRERLDMTGLADRDLLALVTQEGRALVTENVKDFAALHQMLAAAEESHAGLVFTHPRHFPRHERTSAARLATALARFLTTEASSLRRVESFVWWL